MVFMVDNLKCCSWSSLQFQMLKYNVEKKIKYNVEEESVTTLFFTLAISLVNQLVWKPNQNLLNGLVLGNLALYTLSCGFLKSMWLCYLRDLKGRGCVYFIFVCSLWCFNISQVDESVICSPRCISGKKGLVLEMYAHS